MQSVKALVLVVLFAGAPACQRAELSTEVKLGDQLHEFTPDVFHNAFAATTAPVLRVSSGDSIHMTTIDAAGTDEKGVERAQAGNPQTGPFYIEGVEPGDTVAIHMTRLRLNREWAISTDTLSNLAITPALGARMNGRGQLVRWRLDLQGGIAVRENASPTSRSMPYHWRRCSAASLWLPRTRIRPHIPENLACGAVTWTSMGSSKGPPYSCP